MSRDPSPWSLVVGESQLRTGRGSVMGPDTMRRTRWWEGTLSCGHRFERTVRYRAADKPRRGGSQQRSGFDVLPPPKRVRCDECYDELRRAMAADRA